MRNSASTKLRDIGTSMSRRPATLRKASLSRYIRLSSPALCSTPLNNGLAAVSMLILPAGASTPAFDWMSISLPYMPIQPGW
ncbi:hypothetical protein D9M68_863740 [compost metagenome]